MKNAEKTSLLTPYLHARPEILLAYLFGSAAKGRTHALSDIDLAVLVDEEQFAELDARLPWGYRATLTSELIGLLKRNDVDLVLLHQASPLLKFQVVRFGKPLLCRSEERRVAFEVQARREYLDTEHLRAIRRSYLYERIKAYHPKRPESTP